MVNNISRTQNSEQCCQTVALPSKLPHISEIPVGKQNVCEVCEQFTQPFGVSFESCSHPFQNCHSTALNMAVHNLATSPDSCLYVDNYYSPYSHFELCCESRFLYNSRDKCSCNTENLLHQKQLQRSDNSVLMETSSSRCKKCDDDSTLSGNHQFNIFDERVLNRYKNCTQDEQFSGLGCRTNKSVNFFAMRMDLYEDFAKRLGLRKPVMESPLPGTALALIDIKVSYFINAQNT